MAQHSISYHTSQHHTLQLNQAATGSQLHPRMGTLLSMLLSLHKLICVAQLVHSSMMQMVASATIAGRDPAGKLQQHSSMLILQAVTACSQICLLYMASARILHKVCQVCSICLDCLCTVPKAHVGSAASSDKVAHQSCRHCSLSA